MDFSIDMLNVGDADAIILWLKQDGADFVIFLDGGKTEDGDEVINHYNNYIKPHLVSKPIIIVINSHPHLDHIRGLSKIINHFQTDIKRVYFNDPLKYISLIQRNLINEYHQKYSHSSQITGLYESLKDVDDFNTLLKKYNLISSPIFSDTDLGHSLFKVLSPSEAFYKQKVQFFTDKTSLENMHLLKEAEDDINEVEEGNRPCAVVDEKNDTSAENLTSTIIQLTDSNSKRYLFTADAGVDSFESAQNNGFNMTDFHIVQLPHHGSRRNVNTNWICKFNPKQYWVSASGNKKHPRRAVIECIKKNLPDCKTYSTHKGGTKHIDSKPDIFPDRGWSSAEPL
jgi:beta-lactamase superfamily II metal-dependent hydrolase